MVERGAQSAQVVEQETVDQGELDILLGTLYDNAQTWHQLPIKRKVQLLDEILSDTLTVSEDWANAGCAAKGLDPQSAEFGEELFAGVGTFVRLVRTMRDSLDQLDRYGRPHYPGPVKNRVGNRISVGVAPASNFDRILYTGMSAEVWMKPEVNEQMVQSGQALAYKNETETSGVCLVLGAGNVGALAPRDAINQLFGERRTVLIKANPVNDYLVPFWERALRAVIAPGFLRITKGATQAGQYLTSHDLVTHIHITGSDKTYESIVFGSGEAGQKNRKNGQVAIDKEVSAELGCVTPIILVPGKWSRSQLRYQARHLATMFTNNDGFNCLTPRVIITHEGWPQRHDFLEAFKSELRNIHTRKAYYPGAWDRLSRFSAGSTSLVQVGTQDEERMAWSILEGVDSSDRDNIAFNQESWCSLIAETSLPAGNLAQFIEKSVNFCNEVLWGTLSANVIVDPRTLHSNEQLFEEMLGNLKYGSIGINAWSAASLAFSTSVWGAYPGHPPTDIQSGTGFVGNTYLFSTAEKTVIRGPFKPLLTPSWFAGVKNGREVMRRFVEFETKPQWRKVPGLLLSALKG